MKSDLYEVMGVARTANLETIRKAYRRKAAKLHPDTGGDADAMRELNFAHEILSDPEKRRVYDETGCAETADNHANDISKALQQMFLEVFTKNIEDPSVDSVLALRTELDRQEAVVVSNMLNIQALLGRLTQAIPKVVRTDGEPNILGMALEELVSKARQDLEEQKRHRNMVQDMRKALLPYRWVGIRQDVRSRLYVLTTHASYT